MGALARVEPRAAETVGGGKEAGGLRDSRRLGNSFGVPVDRCGFGECGAWRG